MSEKDEATADPESHMPWRTRVPLRCSNGSRCPGSRPAAAEGGTLSERRHRPAGAAAVRPVEVTLSARAEVFEAAGRRGKGDGCPGRVEYWREGHGERRRQEQRDAMERCDREKEGKREGGGNRPGRRDVAGAPGRVTLSTPSTEAGVRLPLPLARSPGREVPGPRRRGHRL